MGILIVPAALGADGSVSTFSLPAFRIGQAPAKAHTQGLEIVGDIYYVTARREDVQPRRALLARTGLKRPDWDVWDITPIDSNGELTTLEHPGGMQVEGERLWIPLAESKRKGRSLIRAYALAQLVPGHPPRVEREFAVNDHIGAVAVVGENQLLGASWDTATVYVWDFSGKLRQRMLTSAELDARGLGIRPGNPEGLAVQDWKFTGGSLLASGLKGAESQLLLFRKVLEPSFDAVVIPLPRTAQGQLAREAMAVSGGYAYFLPGDLGDTNQLFRVSLAGADE